MRGKSFVFLFSLAFCLFALSSLAQAEEQKAQLIFMDEYVVKPSLIAEFEVASKDT